MHSLFTLLAVAAGIATLQPTPVDMYSLRDKVNTLGYQGNYSWRVRRNSTGSRLYLYQQWYSPADLSHLPGQGNGVLVLEGGRVVRRFERPAELAYLNDDEQFVAWADSIQGEGTFRNGGHGNVVRVAAPLGVDWSGRFFYNSNASLQVQIAAIAEPTKILATSKLNAYAIFAGLDKVYLCGWNGSPFVSVCEVYALTSGGASLVATRTIENAHSVYDIDPATGRMLVENASEFFTAYRIVHLEGGKDERIGFAWGMAQLFLQPGVLPKE